MRKFRNVEATCSGNNCTRRGTLAQPGKLVDASFVDVPRQRNRHAENATIKAGAVPEAWAA